MRDGKANGYVLEALGLTKEVNSPDGKLTILDGVEFRRGGEVAVALR